MLPCTNSLHARNDAGKQVLLKEAPRSTQPGSRPSADWRTVPTLLSRISAASIRMQCEHFRGASSYYPKQVAKTMLGDLDGLRVVDNRIQVMAPMPRTTLYRKPGQHRWA